MDLTPEEREAKAKLRIEALERELGTQGYLVRDFLLK